MFFHTFYFDSPGNVHLHDIFYYQNFSIRKLTSSNDSLDFELALFTPGDKFISMFWVCIPSNNLLVITSMNYLYQLQIPPY